MSCLHLIVHLAIKHLAYFFKVRLQRSPFKLGCQGQFHLGNPLHTYSRGVSWLGKHALQGVVAPLGHQGHWFHVRYGHISPSYRSPKASLCPGRRVYFEMIECARDGVKIIHLVGVTGRRSGKGLKFICKPISLENVENV